MAEKNYVLQLMNKYGSIDYTKNTARRFGEQAQNIFDKYTAHLPETKAK